MVHILLEQVDGLLRSPLKHSGLILSSLVDRKLGGSDQTVKKKMEHGYSQVLLILKEKYGEPVYEGEGPVAITYSGPTNPGFDQYKNAACIAWWSISNSLLSVTIDLQDGVFPQLAIEHLNKLGEENQTISGYEIA